MKTFGGLFTIKKFIISIRVTRAMIIGEPRYKVDEFSDLRRFASLTFSVSFCDYLTFQIHFLLEGHKIYPPKAFINLKLRATQKAVYISDTNKFENHIKSSTAHVWGGVSEIEKKISFREYNNASHIDFSCHSSLQKNQTTLIEMSKFRP